MKKILQNFWPVVAILIVVAIFFYPVWLKQEVPIPGDMIVGVYFPWLDYKWGYPTGVPVKNPITTDVVSFTFPMQMLAIDLMKQGHWPLWNSYVLTGTPLLANFQSAPFAPTNFLYFIFDKLDAWSLQIMTQIFLAAVFLYLLLREFGRSKIASTFGGLFFAFAGFMMIWMEWNGHSLTAAFFPLIIFLVIKWLKTAKIIWGSLLSLSLVLQIFSGYPQIILYQFMLLPLVIFFLDKKLFLNLKKISGLTFFSGLGLGLAAIQILPGLELLSLSQRKIEDVINVSAFLPWKMMITFLAPDFFGNHATGNFWGPGDYTYVTGFSGVVVIILASLGIITFFKNTWVKFSLFTVGFSLLIALPNPLSILLKESGLLGLQAASAHRALILSNLGFAILAAFGLDSILEKKLNFKNIRRALYLPAILILGFLFVALAENLNVALKNMILPTTFLILTAILLFLNLFLKKKVVLVLVLGSLSLLELFRFGWKFTPFSPKHIIFPKTPVIEFLQNKPQPFRVFAEDVIPINLLMPYNLSRVEGYDAVYPIRFAKYLSVLNSGSVNFDPMGRYGTVKNIESNLLNIANAKYFLAVKKDGRIPKKFEKPYFKQVFEDKTVVVLENLKALSRAEMFYDWEIIKDDTQVLTRLIDPDFLNTKKIILEKEPIIVKNNGQGEVSFSESPNIKIIKVNTNQDGILFIADAWFPGWKARIDGKSQEILRANYNFMAITLEKGIHKVVLEYQPTSFENGKMVSLISVSILFLLFLYGSFSQKFNRNS